MLDLEKVKKCYGEYQDKLNHYLEIDRYYYGNTKPLKAGSNLPNRSNARVYTNFIQKLVDEEAMYSFGNKVTFKAIEDDQKDALKLISYHFKNNGAGYDSSAGKRLIEFHIGYEINYFNKDNKFRSKWVSPVEGNAYFNEYDELEFFIYIHTKVKDKKKVNYVDVYDENNVYYLDNNLNLIDTKAHNFGTVPVGVGIIDNVQYTEENGYIEGDKTIYRTIRPLQDCIEQNLSDITQEITDFHNAILKFYGIELENELDNDGNVILGADGRPVKKEPILGHNSILYFGDKKVEDAEWLIKNVNDTFIKNTRDDMKDLIDTLTNHVDNNEKLQSNLSGIALRSKLQCLEARVKANEAAMEDIIRKRIQCLFNYLRKTKKADFDENLISIEFTPCVPQDIGVIADVISKIPHEVLSNETKRSMLPNVNNVEAEQDRIDKEAEKSMPKINLDNIPPIGGEGAANE